MQAVLWPPCDEPRRVGVSRVGTGSSPASTEFATTSSPDGARICTSVHACATAARAARPKAFIDRLQSCRRRRRCRRSFVLKSTETRNDHLSGRRAVPGFPGRPRHCVCALHGVSPRDRWLCVLPGWQMNVNVNVPGIAERHYSLLSVQCVLALAPCRIRARRRRRSAPLPPAATARRYRQRLRLHGALAGTSPFPLSMRRRCPFHCFWP